MMLKNAAIFFTSLLVFVAPVFAQDVRIQPIDEFKENRQNIRENIREKKVDLRKKLTTDRQEIKEATREQAMKERAEKNKLRRQEVVKEAKERRAEFKQKLQELRNEKKKALVAKLSENLNKINTNAVAHLQKVVSRLLEIVTKIENRIARLKENGVDTSQTETALSNVKNDITNLQSALEEQKAKDYTPQISTEEKLGPDVSTSFQSLRSDLKGLHEQVKAIKNKLKDIMRSLKQEKSENQDTESSSTNQGQSIEIQ